MDKPIDYLSARDYVRGPPRMVSQDGRSQQETPDLLPVPETNKTPRSPRSRTPINMIEKEQPEPRTQYKNYLLELRQKRESQDDDLGLRRLKLAVTPKKAKLPARLPPLSAKSTAPPRQEVEDVLKFND